MTDATQSNETQAMAVPDPAKAFAGQEPAVLLALCLFGEARGESEAARRAVAQVVVNRARRPHRVFGSRAGADFHENLRRVILQPRQFSCFNPDDPNFHKLLRPLDFELPAVWERCLRCAAEALAAKDQPDALTANSDHYFDDSIQPPSWAAPANHTVKIGRLRFYRLYLPPVAWAPGTLPAEAPSASRTRTHSVAVPPGGAATGSPHSMSLPVPFLLCVRDLGPISSRRRQGSGRPSSPFATIALALLCLGLTACSDLERTAYRVLAATRAEFEAEHQLVLEKALHGLLTEEQWDRFQVAGHRFVETHGAAAEALDAWSRSKTKGDTARLEAMLELLPRLLREIHALVEGFEEEPGRQEPEIDDTEEAQEAKEAKEKLPSSTSSTSSASSASSASSFLPSGQRQ